MTVLGRVHHWTIFLRTIKHRYIFVPSPGIHPVSFCPVYCASKFGVIGFTRSVAPASIQHAVS